MAIGLAIVPGLPTHLVLELNAGTVENSCRYTVVAENARKHR